MSTQIQAEKLAEWVPLVDEQTHRYHGRIRLSDGRLEIHDRRDRCSVFLLPIKMEDKKTEEAQSIDS